MAQSTKKSKKRPEISRHKTGLWYKYYKGQFYYFYRWDGDDPEGLFSKDKWRHDKEYLDRGQVPPEYDPLGGTCKSSTSLTVADLCNYWLGTKDTLLQAGELRPRTFEEYGETCSLLTEVVGTRLPAKLCGPDRFEKVRRALAKRYNANGQAKRITQIRSVFTTAYEDRMLEDPPNFGRTFRKPKAAAFRKLRNDKGEQCYTPEEFHAIYKCANINLKGMMLLGLQAGFGNEECAALPRDAIQDGWITWARVKTAIPRRVPLWPETQAILTECIEHASAQGEETLVFVSKRGKHYVSPRMNGERVTGVFRDTKRRAPIETARTFYDLRRTFETVAGEAIDQVAVDAIMGHTPSETNMPARYRQKISEQRLEAVVEHVRQWLGPLQNES